MTADTWISVVIVLASLVVSAFFSASETALTASSRASMMRLDKNGNRNAGVVVRLLNTRDRLIGALLLGNNLANIGASTLTTSVLLSLFGEVGVLYATIVMSVLVIVFAEVMPKTAAFSAPERIALRVARPVSWVAYVLGPILRAVEVFVRWSLHAVGFRVDSDTPLLTPQERLRGAVDLLHREGGVEKHDRDMFGGLLNIQELTVADVMVHRTEMVTVNADDPPGEIVRTVLATPFTRIPLWREKPDNIVGVLHAKDLARAIEAAHGEVENVDIVAVALKPWFVPDLRPLSEQLKAFRRRKTHFALVVDEYGELQGLVTLEDILEEIVGDISDEHDIAVAGVHPQPDGSVTVEGAVPIRDLNRAMDWNLPAEEATTIAGLVIHEARSIPQPGQSFVFHGFRFVVLRRERNRLTALRIMPLARPPRAA